MDVGDRVVRLDFYCGEDTEFIILCFDDDHAVCKIIDHESGRIYYEGYPLEDLMLKSKYDKEVNLIRGLVNNG